MNRKGDIAVIMIAVAAVILIIASLLIFLDFKTKFQTMQGLDEMTGEVEFGEKYIINEAGLIGKDTILDRNENCAGEGDLNYKFQCNLGIRDLKASLAGNFFAKIENYDFSFVKNEDSNYILDVKGIKLKSERGASNIERNFDLEVRFGAAGEILAVKRDGAEKA